jgi:hypothetical protein
MDKSDYERLAYLQNLDFIRFGSDWFASSFRLPLMSAILELTPNLDEWFQNREVAQLIGSNSANTHLELERYKQRGMVEQRDSTTVQLRNYRRLDSPRWDIARVALATAKAELGL